LEGYTEEWRRRFGVASGEYWKKKRRSLRDAVARANVGKEGRANRRPQGGVACVANKGLTNSDFGSVASKGLTGEFHGSVANKRLSGVFAGGRDLRGRVEKYRAADGH